MYKEFCDGCMANILLNYLPLIILGYLWQTSVLMFSRWERHDQGSGGWAGPHQQNYAFILCESCSKTYLLSNYKWCLTNKLRLKLSFPWCAVFFWLFSQVFPKLFVLYTSESRRLFYCLKIEWGNWSSLHSDKTKYINKCFCICLEFIKCGPISCILVLCLLSCSCHMLDGSLVPWIKLTPWLSDLLSPLHILLDGMLDPWTCIVVEYFPFPSCFHFILFCISVIQTVIFMLFQEVFCCILCSCFSLLCLYLRVQLLIKMCSTTPPSPRPIISHFSANVFLAFIVFICNALYYTYLEEISSCWPFFDLCSQSIS